MANMSLAHGLTLANGLNRYVDTQGCSKRTYVAVANDVTTSECCLWSLPLAAGPNGSRCLPRYTVNWNGWDGTREACGLFVPSSILGIRCVLSHTYGVDCVRLLYEGTATFLLIKPMSQTCADGTRTTTYLRCHVAI